MVEKDLGAKVVKKLAEPHSPEVDTTSSWPDSFINFLLDSFINFLGLIYSFSFTSSLVNKTFWLSLIDTNLPP